MNRLTDIEAADAWRIVREARRETIRRRWLAFVVTFGAALALQIAYYFTRTVIG